MHGAALHLVCGRRLEQDRGVGTGSTVRTPGLQGCSDGTIGFDDDPYLCAEALHRVRAPAAHQSGADDGHAGRCGCHGHQRCVSVAR